MPRVCASPVAYAGDTRSLLPASRAHLERRRESGQQPGSGKHERHGAQLAACRVPVPGQKSGGKGQAGAAGDRQLSDTRSHRLPAGCERSRARGTPPRDGRLVTSGLHGRFPRDGKLSSNLGRCNWEPARPQRSLWISPRPMDFAAGKCSTSTPSMALSFSVGSPSTWMGVADGRSTWARNHAARTVHPLR